MCDAFLLNDSFPCESIIMPVPLSDLTEQHRALLPEMRDAFVEVVESGRLILGHYVEKFEEQLAAYCGVNHAVGVSSGTDAITAALMTLDLQPGDEVIVSPFTYLHTAESILRAGGTPVFADIRARSFNIDPDAVEAVVTEKTRAVLAVHLYGLPCDMFALMEIAERHGLTVIEDADMAIGATYHGRKAGSLGHMATFSFYPTKTLAGAGDSGAVVTDDPELAKRLRSIRVHGLEPGFVVRKPSGAFRMAPLQAALLSVKLPHVDQWVKRRRDLAKRYQKQFEPLAVTTPDSAEDIRHAYSLYTLRVRGGGREPLRHHLDAMGIGNRVYYPRPLHLQPAYAGLGYERGTLPNAERACDEALSIPMFTEMNTDQQDEVVAAVREYFAAD